MVCAAGGTAPNVATGWAKAIRWAANLGGSAIVASGTCGCLVVEVGRALVGVRSVVDWIGRVIRELKLRAGRRFRMRRAKLTYIHQMDEG